MLVFSLVNWFDGTSNLIFLWLQQNSQSPEASPSVEYDANGAVTLRPKNKSDPKLNELMSRMKIDNGEVPRYDYMEEDSVKVCLIKIFSNFVAMEINCRSTDHNL